MRCLPWLAFLLAISNLIPLYSSREISPYAVIITIPGTRMRINNRNTYLRKKGCCTARRINTFQQALTFYSIMFLMLYLKHKQYASSMVPAQRLQLLQPLMTCTIRAEWVSTCYHDCWMMSLGQMWRHMLPVLLLLRRQGTSVLEIGYGTMSRKESSHVALITLAAWDLVCHVRDVSGLQMALQRSREMATRLKVDTLTEIPVCVKNSTNGTVISACFISNTVSEHGNTEAYFPAALSHC